MTKPDYIYKLMRDENRPYFIITDQKDNQLRTHLDNPNVENAIEQIQEFLKYNEGVFTICMRTTPKPVNGRDKGLVYTFSNSLLSNELKENPVKNPVTGIGSPFPSPAAMYGFDPLQKVMELMQENNRLQQENIAEKFRNDLKAMEERLSSKDGDSAFQQTAINTLAGLFAPGMGAKVGLAGFGDQPLPADDAKAKINSAVVRLIKLDPNFAQNISKLADLAEKSPTIYKMAISHLNSM
jgi:hypothetical protein